MVNTHRTVTLINHEEFQANKILQMCQPRCVYTNHIFMQQNTFCPETKRGTTGKTQLITLFFFAWRDSPCQDASILRLVKRRGFFLSLHHPNNRSENSHIKLLLGRKKLEGHFRPSCILQVTPVCATKCTNGVTTLLAHAEFVINPLNPELNPICYLLALLGAHHFLHVSRIRVKLLTFRLLMSYIYIWSTHS